MNVLFFTLGDETVASSRTRVFQYLPHLKKLGVQRDLIQYRTGLEYRLLARPSTGRLRGLLIKAALKAVSLFHCFYSVFQTVRFVVKAHGADIVFIQKVLLPIPVQALLSRLNPRIVFDYDDALYADEKSYSKNRLDAQMKRSRLVVLENENTEAYARQFHIPYLRITGPIDCSRYSPGSLAKKTEDELIIGWIGSRSTTQYLELIRESLRAIAAKYPHVVLELIGAGPFDLPNVRIRHFAWTLDSEVDLLRRFDIGIMPLADNEFTRGKGGYKLLQYMAMGIPSVASPVGVNREILIEEKTGFLCGNDQLWVRAFDRLLGDADLRKTVGMAARLRAVQEYSYDVSAPRLVKALEFLPPR